MIRSFKLVKKEASKNSEVLQSQKYFLKVLIKNHPVKMPKFSSYNLFRIFKIYYFSKTYTNSCLQRIIITVKNRRWLRRNRATCHFIARLSKYLHRCQPMWAWVIFKEKKNGWKYSTNSWCTATSHKNS